VEGQRASALRFGDRRVQAFFTVLVVFSLQARGFTNPEIGLLLAQLLGLDPANYPAGRMTYDLRRLRLHGIIERTPRSHRYQLAASGLRIALLFSRTYAKLLRPKLAKIMPVAYTPDEAPGVISHPLYWPGRDYINRPNFAARRNGTGGGRSLILSGHIDTVRAGSRKWTYDPFGGDVEGNHLYGRGSNDMKAGIATTLVIVEALARLDVRSRGNLIFESGVDEEFGGVNGTLAGRLMGFNADAAVIASPLSCALSGTARRPHSAHPFRRTQPGNPGSLASERDRPGSGVSDGRCRSC
jgi:hypothetical protein